MDKKGLNTNGNVKKSSIEINEDRASDHFLCIQKNSNQNLFIGSIRKFNSSLVIIELHHEGKHLLARNTVKALSDITREEYKKPVQINDQYPNSFFLVKKEFVSKLFVFSAIDSLLARKKKALVAIDGNATSGKTTFGKLLSKVYDCNVFHVDNYFQKPVIHSNNELSKYASNINFKRMNSEIFEPIFNQKSSEIRLMDLSTHTLSDTKTILYKPLSIIEGAYSMHPFVIDYYDLKIFMKTTFFKQIVRIRKRNGFKKLIQFIKKWIPMENKYFRDLQVENQSDIILIR